MQAMTILMIDDDRRVLDLLKRFLYEEKYSIITAENGMQGVEAARRHAPKVIFCDIMMPELDGFGVLQALQSDITTSKIPFFFLTSKIQPEDRQLGIEAGATGYLAKPTSRNQLLEALRECSLI
ncbi:MAG: response regulator [Candidatus Kapabacteria bacterium]|nr:response regulator [Candidatus Kapabacteria bacterium]